MDGRNRILQSLVLARDGLLAPELGSIEEYLSQHTQEYYDVLQRVQGGRYLPDRDATPWVRFCIDAHLTQAGARLRQVQEASERWAVLEALVQDRAWPDRLVIALEQSRSEGADRSRYAAEADVSLPTATADLRRLVDAGLIVARGGGRNTRYLASPHLLERLP